MNRLFDPRACAALILLFASSASAQEAISGDPSGADARVARDHSYSVGVSLVSSRFRSETGDRMGMTAPGVTVNYTVGRTMGFGLRANIAFPMHGRLADDDGSSGVNLVRMYDAQRLSFDATFLFVYRLRPTDTLDVVLGAGLHVHTMRLVSAQYDPIEIIQGGLGGAARVEKRLSSHVFVSGEVFAAFDPVDFIRHIDRAVYVAPVALTLSVGARR